MKIILYTGLGLVVLCVGFVLIIPSLMDWNQYKGQIVDRVAHELGREFSVSGDISLSLIPKTKFSLTGVHIGSIEGASVPSMAQVKMVDVEVSLVPLLMGSIQIIRVILVEPTIILERLPDGRTNWASAKSEGARPQLLLGKFLRDISLEEFVISAGNFEYVDVANGHHYEIEDANLRLSAPSLSGPFQFHGALRAFGNEVVVESMSVEIDSHNNFLTRGEISSEGLQLKYSASSKTTNEGGAFWKGAVKFSPDGGKRFPAKWARLQEALLGANEIDSELSQLTSDFTWQDGVLDFSQLNFRVGELRGTATVSIGPNRISGRVDLGHLNLDKVYNSQSFAEGDELSGELIPKVSMFLSSFSERPDFLADVVLAADLIQYKGEAIRDVVVDAGVRGGVIMLNQGSASLPGASSIALEGQFYSEQNYPGFLGTAKGSSDNLRALLKWLSVELGPLAGERLRRLLFSTKIQGTIAAGSLIDLDLQLDTSQIRGGVAYAISNGRPGLGIGLHVDQLDLDAYLPRVSDDESTVDSDSKNYTKILSSFDADFDVQLDEIIANGIPISGVALKGLWQQDGLDVREIVIQEFVGSSAKFTGILTEISSNPSIQGSFSAVAENLSSLARIMPEINDLPKYLLGPIEVELAVQGDLEQITMDGFVKILESQITIRGSITDVLKTRKVSLFTEVNVASLSGFGNLLSDYDVVVPWEVLEPDIPLAVSAEVTGIAPNFNIDVAVMAAGGLLEAQGTLVQMTQALKFDLYGNFTHSNIGDFLEIFAGAPVPEFLKIGRGTAAGWSLKGGPTKFFWEGNITRGDLKIGGVGSYDAGENDMALVLQHPDISTFVSDFGSAEHQMFSDGAINLSVILQSNLAGIQVSELDVSTPASDLRGSFALYTAGDKQEVLGAFTSRNLDLNEFAALASGISFGKVDGIEDSEDEAAHSPSVASDWDGDGSISWDGLAAEFTLKAVDVRGLGQKFENIDAKFNITSRTINIEYFKGLWGGGNFSAKAILANKPSPSFDINILVEEADLTEVLSSYEGFGPISGRVKVEANLVGEGENKEQWLASLSGNGRITGTAGGAISGISFEEFVEQSRGLDQPGDFMDLIPTILDGGQTLFTGFNGNFKAERGQIRTEDLVFMLDEGRATVSGIMDLGAWTQELEVETALASHDFPLPLKLLVTGDIGVPDVRVHIPEFKDYLRSVFSETPSVPDGIQETIQDVQNIGLEQVLDSDGSIEAAEDLIERLIKLDSPQQSGIAQDDPTSNQPEDDKFRDLLQDLLQD